MRWIALLTLTVSFSIVHIAPGDDAQDGKALEGVWRATAAELGGKPFPEKVRKSIKLTVKGGTYSVAAGKEPDRGTVKLDPSASPQAMDITGTEGPNKGKTVRAIYRLDGDTLQICYDLSGRSRPTEFKSLEGSLLFLVTYEREKQ